MTTMITTTAYMLRHFIQFVPTEPLPTVVGFLPKCSAPLCRQSPTAFWVPVFVCETLIFILTAGKLHSQLKDEDINFGGRRLPKLAAIVFRGGFALYIGEGFLSPFPPT
ncbi:hypothetical protein AN958_06570 [Leucoagaricus sp. SymC.cos]|nr:hypothetical protein AN958_06570 [Leucoagaricus sp. SymC.cos]